MKTKRRIKEADVDASLAQAVLLVPRISISSTFARLRPAKQGYTWSVKRAI